MKSSGSLVQCVPNFSEGIDTVVLQHIASSIEECNVHLIDWSADKDHNRSVFTYIGAPEAVLAASLSASRVASREIDMRNHHGVHPRLGALDVLPFVPLLNIDLEECAVIAHKAGELIAGELDIPAFFYDAASSDGRSLPQVRKGAFIDFSPDRGPEQPHVKSGAVAIGARGPLIAFNVNIIGGSLNFAKEIATHVRKKYAGRVRALGLYLKSRGVYQVSMNVIEPSQVTLVEIVEFIKGFSDVLETELIGVMPGFAAFASLQKSLECTQLKPGQVLLENWNISKFPD
jgi:glutamate formiminotransferase